MNKENTSSLDKINNIKQLLEQISNDLDSIKEPILDDIKGVRGAPHRHPYMSAVVWYLTNSFKRDNIKILEIGSYVGSSLFTWVTALNKYAGAEATVYSIDPLESAVDDTDYSAGEISKVGEIEEGVKFDFAYKMLRHNMKYMSPLGSCIHIRSMSSDILPILRDETFDLIYIDGNHGYKAVKEDLIEAKRLLKPNGIICGDDLEIQGDECDMQYAKENSHLDFIVDPKTNIPFHPGVTLAAWEIVGRVSSWDGFWAMELKNGVLEKISLQNAPLEIPSHFSKELQDRATCKFKPLQTANFFS